MTSLNEILKGPACSRVKKVTIDFNCFVRELANQYKDPQRAFRDMPTPDPDGAVANFFRFELFGAIMQMTHRATQEQHLGVLDIDERSAHATNMKRIGRLFSYAFNTVKQNYLYDGMQHVTFTVTTKEDPNNVARTMLEFMSNACSYLMNELESSYTDYDMWLKQAYREIIAVILDMTFTGPTQFNYISVSFKDA
jgi:hypothetical protein